MSNHLSSGAIGVLAEKTVNKEPYNTTERNNMIHMKDCKICYEDFCTALMLEGVFSPEGGRLLKRYYKEKGAMVAAKSGETIKEKATQLVNGVIAGLKVVRQNVGELAGATIEQLSQCGSVIKFQPVLAGATRGGIDEDDTSTKVVDENDPMTFVIVDAKDNAVLVQVHMEELGYEKIEVVIVYPDGEESPIELKYSGGVAKALITVFPETDFEIRIKKK